MGSFEAHLLIPSDDTAETIMDEDEDRERPEIAEAFYNELGHQIRCMKCASRACVRVMRVYFCGRCWEFLETPQEDD